MRVFFLAVIFIFIFPSVLTLHNFRTAGSLKKHFFRLVQFSSSQIRTWDSWVRSAKCECYCCAMPSPQSELTLGKKSNAA